MSLDDIAPGSRVVVAMSGGVDSSVTAALLKERGCEVIGMTLQLYDHGQAISRPGSCCAGRDIHDARRVADRLGIPHYVLDYEAVFRRQVMDAFGESYLAGETPIPCVLCNQKVKFADLLDMARDLGAEALATGHYVRRSEGAHGPILQRAIETERDQSYFLFTTTRDQLAFLRFPLGALPKQETRELARRLELPVAEKPDSQDICFIPTGRYRDFLERWRPETHQPGDIVDTDGRVLGHHSGIAGYTVGQRRGLGIAAPEPLYVIAVDPPSARVIVGPVTALQKDTFEIRSVNWLGDAPLDDEGVAVQVKVRSTMAAIDAHVERLADDRARVTLHQPFAAIAPGQACVFYQGDRLLGGGWIERDPSIGSKMGSSRQPMVARQSTVS